MNVSREMRIIKKLRHPNIVQLLQIMETNSKIYLIMESVLGGELYEMIVNSKKYSCSHVETVSNNPRQVSSFSNFSTLSNISTLSASPTEILNPKIFWSAPRTSLNSSTSDSATSINQTNNSLPPVAVPATLPLKCWTRNHTTPKKWICGAVESSSIPCCADTFLSNMRTLLNYIDLWEGESMISLSIYQ